METQESYGKLLFLFFLGGGGLGVRKKKQSFDP